MEEGAKTTVEETSVINLQKYAETSRMWLSAVSVLLVGVGGSLAVSIGSPAMVFYKERNTSLDEPMTEGEGALFASVFLLAMTTGCIICWASVQCFGRKRTIIVGCSGLLVSWAMMYFAGTAGAVVGARFVSGLSVAAITTTNYMILNEISTISRRGIMGMLETLTVNVAWAAGLFLYGFSGLSFHELVITLAACLVPAMAMLLLVAEESPHWLVKVGRENEARETLKRLRGRNYAGLDVEMEELVKCCAADETSGTGGGLLTRSFVKPFGLLVVLFIFQAACGMDLLSYYSLEVMYELLGGDVHKGNVLGTLFQVGFALGYGLSTPILRRCPRRAQLIASALLVAAFEALLGACFWIQQGLETRSLVLDYLMMAAVPTSSLVYGLGFGPVCFTLLGELFPARHKAPGTSFVCAVRYLIVAGINQCFPDARALVGLHFVLLASSVMALAGAAAAWYFLPETAGKSLTELAALFEPRAPPPAPPASSSTSVTESWTAAEDDGEGREDELEEVKVPLNFNVAV